MKYVLIFIAFLIVFSLAITYWYIPAIVIALLAVWKIIEAMYFRSKSFQSIKNRIQSYVYDCNELNQHIEDLKETGLISNKSETGSAIYQDKSKWNVKRPELRKQKYAANVYNCTRAVCDGARRDPFKYVCKYFGIDATEETLHEFENILNSFEAAEDGKVSLQKERENILSSIKNDIPFLFLTFSKKELEKQLGFDVVDFKSVYFPKYTFQYISSGGNTSAQCDVVMDLENLNKFVVYLSEKIKFRKSAAGQRALMTSKLRQAIKERDGFTCLKCGASISKEPNLLLEIDHIIPVSKGGMTTEENLQTLCWRCNRSKGAKI